VAKRATILKVSGLRRAFGPNTIFDKFNLEVRTGEAIALTGRNGAGKSTLLRCLVGADRPDDGSVEVCGNAMTETSPEIRRDLATVIDDIDFFPDLSVVDLLARAHGIADPDEVVDQVLEELQLVPQSGQLPGTLSTGQQRRLALATAFVRPRKLLILDEPEQRLDTEGVSWLARRLKSERQKGLAIIFASHEPELVDTVGNSGDPAWSSPRMSSLEAGADDFAYEQPRTEAEAWEDQRVVGLGKWCRSARRS
jgi:ABC-type multidrug transport system ATPase subunit